MTRKLVLTGLLLLPLLDAVAVESVILGRAIGNEETGVGVDCPKDYICMDTFVRWKISVSRTLTGPEIDGRVVAVRLQHGSIVPSYLPRFKLFVLRPIEDAAERKLMGAEYALVDVSEVTEMYCLNRKPQDIGLEPAETFALVGSERHSYCFRVPEEDDR